MRDAGDLVPEDAVRSTQEAAAAPEAPGALSRLLLELAQAPEEDLAASWQGTLRPGEVVGRYQIRDEIGRGGFGAVYEAFYPELGRAVALKALRPGRTRQELTADCGSRRRPRPSRGFARYDMLVSHSIATILPYEILPPCLHLQLS